MPRPYLLLLLSCLLSIASGCREQTADLRDLWTTLENDLDRKLEGVMAHHYRMKREIGELPMPDSTNVEGRAARLQADSMLAAHERIIQAVKSLLLRDRGRREKLSISPSRVDMQRALDSARVDYTHAMNDLTTIDQEHATIRSLAEAGVNAKDSSTMRAQDSGRALSP